MKWLWGCFGGRKDPSRRKNAHARSSKRNGQDNFKAHASPTNLHTLGAHIKSPFEVPAYDEPFQPRQAVASSPHGSKLFKRKSIQRAKSCGSSSAFENGAKRILDKHAVGHIDRLHEEVEGLKRRLAQEEEASQKLRHEVSYLRSCGVLQSPDRQRKDRGTDRDLHIRREERSQPGSPSWLGLNLSPTSRFQLEEQLRTLAADEMSKVQNRGLTNGQKTLIVATKLWRKQGHRQEDHQSADASLSDLSGANHVIVEDDFTKRRFDQQSPLTNPDPSFREQLQFGKFSNICEPSECGSPGSTVTEIDTFSFHPSASGDNADARHLIADKFSLEGKPQLQRTPSCPEPMMTCFPSSNYYTERVEYEYGKQESPQHALSLESQNADHVQARRFIDLRYQELEEKLLKSPKRELVLHRQDAESSNPCDEDLGAEPDVSDVSEDTNRLEVQDISSNNGSPSSLGGKTYFAGKSGRMWRPLSPVRESDSGRSSREGLAVSSAASASHFLVSDSAESSCASDLKSSLRTIISASTWEQKEVSSHHETSDSHDDDLFTLLPARLHHGYESWHDGHRSDGEIQNGHEVDPEDNSGTGASWASGDEAESEDIAPIRCQSPAFSPRRVSKKIKVADGLALKVEDYQRDKYFQEMGYNVDAFLFRSVDFTESGKSGTDHQERISDISASVSIEDKGRRIGMQSAVPEELDLRVSTSNNAIGANDCEDCDHPVLSSIENLPKVKDNPTVCNSSATLKDNQHDRIQVLELEGQLSGDDGRQQFKPSILASEFSFIKNVHDNSLAQPRLESDERLRMSLHGFVYEEDEQDLEFQIAEEPSSSIRRSQNSKGISQGDAQIVIGNGPGDSRWSCEVFDQNHESPIESKNVECAGGQFQQTSDRQSSIGAPKRNDRIVRLDSSVRNDVLSHAQSLGYTIRIPELKDSVSDIELAFESSSVGEDSDLNKESDETFHDCESPTFSETSSELSRSGSLQPDPNHQYFRSSKVRTVKDDAVSGLKTPDISPDDRPILGTVATHWGDTSNSEPKREWDGLGIPNSTSKFKEMVSWHNTPFETRLEQALANLPLVPELHNQRTLSKEVALN